MQKLFVDFLPILLFFVAFKCFDIFVATGVAIVTTLAQVALSWARHRRVGATLWVNLAVILTLGGTTLFLRDETFVKWKPTALYWCFALCLALGPAVFKKNPLRALLSGQIELPETAWSILNAYWAACFLFLGFANLAVAFLLGFSTEAWVNFKLFGGLGFILLFAALQGFLIAKYLPDDDKAP